MKVIAANVAYIQKKDIDYLKQSDLKIPEFIFYKVFGSNIDENNEYEFIKFTKRNEIEYFKNLDWIIDYNQVKNLTDEKIVELVKETANELNRIAEKFNKMSEHKKEKHLDMITQCELLDYKMNSLRDALWFKQGHINMKMPVIFDYQSCYQNSSEKKKLKSLFEKKKTP